MIRLLRALFTVVFALLFGAESALAQSTINTGQPASKSDVSSLVVRQLAGAAASDINGILGMHAAESLAGCPVTSLAGVDCLVIGTIPASWYKSYGGGSYALFAYLNLSTGVFTLPSITVGPPAITSVTGLGTGVATALGVNVGGTGAFVVSGGSMNLANATGLPGQFVAPASAAALNTALASAISAGQVGLSLVPGTYSVAKTTTGSDGFPTAVLINTPGNFTFDGQGSTLSLVGADVSSYANIITAQNAVPGTTLTLKNLTLQYASPPFAQAVLSSKTACVANANGSATFTMYSGFAPAWASVLRLDQVNPNANPVTGTVGLFVANVYDDYGTSPLPMTNLGGGSYSLAFNGTAQCAALASSSMTVGYAFTLMNTQFYTEGIKFLGVASVVLDNVRVVDTAGHAFTFIGANNVTIKNGTAVSPALGAWRSSNAGGFAFIATSGVVTADPSTQALATGDDSFFIAPYIDSITLVNSRTSIQTAGVGATPFAVGDTFQFIDPNGVLQGTAIVSGTSTSAGNTVFAFYSPGAPSGVSTSWVMVDRSQAPSLCVISGTYGGSPTRAIYTSCIEQVFNQPTVKDTGAGAIYVTYDDGNIGIVPSSVVFNQPTAVNTNYAADAFDATFEVAGWNIARTAAATAGQIGTVAFNNPVCQTSGTGCLYAGSAKEVAVSFGSFQSWYQVAGTPGNTQGCGSLLYESAVAFCNDTNVVYSPGYFLSGGSEEGYSGSTINSPALPSASLVGLTAAGSGFGVAPSTWTDTQACTAGQVSVDASYIYICTATNVVKRTALTTF
jgi:hypothetical protein